jgi:hypothetical protein
VAVLAAGAARAQDAREAARPRFIVELRHDAAGAARAPLVRVEQVLGDGVLLGALRNGFPVRLAYRLSLWRDSWPFDRLEREATWDVVVVQEPVSGAFELLRTGGAPERHNTVGSLAAALAMTYTADLLPERGGRHYFVATLDIETLSISELEEVERWLRGDLARALTERGDIGDALSRGARSVMIRLSGLPQRRFEARSPTFR